MEKYLHNCPDWDGLEISEYSMEFRNCNCFFDNEEVRLLVESLDRELEETMAGYKPKDLK